MTPDQVHFGQAGTIYAARQEILDAAFLSTPERFVGKPPKPPQSRPPSGSIHQGKRKKTKLDTRNNPVI